MEALDRVQSELMIESETGQIQVIELDLADLQTVRAAVDKVYALANRLDILVCNAGTSQGSIVQLVLRCTAYA